jgi:ADP-ribose pyrophosphatase YjhB (NUDIX family)
VGETLIEATAREVLEETGLVVGVGPVVEVLDRVHRDADGRIEYHFVLVDYLCTARGGVLQSSSDAADARWVPARELQGLRVSAATIEVIRKAFGLAGAVWPLDESPDERDS